jgi:hypothetical protein
VQACTRKYGGGIDWRARRRLSGRLLFPSSDVERRPAARQLSGGLLFAEVGVVKFRIKSPLPRHPSVLGSLVMAELSVGLERFSA